MRILLTSSASHAPPRGGSTRSNLAWLEYLASRGHDCRIVAPAPLRDTPRRAARVASDLDEQGIRTSHLKTDAALGFDALRKGDITLYAVADPARLRAVLRRKLRIFQPDWTLVSSEDLGQVLLREAVEHGAGRAIYLAHTPQMFPFGPASLNPNPAGAEAAARAAGIVAIGNYTANYVEKHLGRRPSVIHPPVYGAPPFVRRDPDAGGLITMINASAVKGIGIFLALARRFPEYRFGALHGWGTIEDDLRALAELPNVTRLAKAQRIETVLEKTRILLVPSLWPEGFGLVVTQAMLMGIPVLASDLGGLVEAKAGTRYLLPVRPVERYLAAFDENHMPVPIIPEQNIEPWARAVEELMTGRELYRREAESARAAALRLVASVRPSAFEDFLLALVPAAPERAAQAAPVSPAARQGGMEELSAERRALLLRMMKEKARARR
ncbi:MAG: glycosyltransferase [Bryobacteraceae bacterium]|nr:glycosyltransferase [Bryobacteraceae bacterium]